MIVGQKKKRRKKQFVQNDGDRLSIARIIMRGDAELKIKTSIAALFALIFVLCSCQKTQTDPRNAVLSMVGACESRVAGSIYTTESSQGSPDHLSPELLSELFGDFDFSGVRCAVYLAGGVSLFELSVFDCPNPDTAEAVGALCAVRFDRAIKAAKRLGMSDVSFSVKIFGNRVLAAMCEGSERAVSAGLEKIKEGKSVFNMKKG